ncbi:glycoside hydrolase domain-containing protein, partial [Cutibacterium acnes]
FDLENEEVKIVFNQWRSIWVDFTPNGKTLAGNYDIKIKFLSSDESEVGSIEHTVEVIDALLPKQELMHTEWFHYDCIGTYYGVEMLSEKHWTYIERFIKTAVEHGIYTTS